MPTGVQSLVDQEAPEFTLKDFDGKEIKLSQFKDKPIILDFFVVSGKTSKRQVLMMEKLYQKYGKQKEDEPQKLVILGITSETNKEKVQKFVAKNKLTFPILFEGVKTFNDYKVTQLPTLLFIDKDGSICSAHSGKVTYNEAKFDAEIKNFMAGAIPKLK